MKNVLLLCISLIFVANPYAASASNIVINSVDDGTTSAYGGGGLSRNYVQAGGGQEGLIKFSTSQVTAPIAQAYLSVNPFGMPLRSNSVSVYGYQSSNGQLTPSEYTGGTFLGNWSIPANLNYGQDTFFDVTQFMQGVSSPFVGFNLFGNAGVDIFSSRQYNYGHPSQLIITPTPEPTTLVLLGLGGLLFRRRRR